jgi:hypothetical protein
MAPQPAAEPDDPPFEAPAPHVATPSLRSVSLDSLPRDSMGPGGLRAHPVSPFVVPFVPSQPIRPHDPGPIEPPESPLADVVPAARTPQDEEEPEPAS